MKTIYAIRNLCLLSVYTFFTISCAFSTEDPGFYISNLDALAKELENKAVSDRTPTLVTNKVFENFYKSKVKPLSWHSVENYQILLSSEESIEFLKIKAINNEKILMGQVEQKNVRSGKVRLASFEQSGNSLYSSLKQYCGLNVKWKASSNPKIAMHSGKPIKMLEGCKMIAWAFAANNIKLAKSDKPNEIILVDAADIQ